VIWLNLKTSKIRKSQFLLTQTSMCKPKIRLKRHRMMLNNKLIRMNKKNRLLKKL